MDKVSQVANETRVSSPQPEKPKLFGMDSEPGEVMGMFHNVTAILSPAPEQLHQSLQLVYNWFYSTCEGNPFYMDVFGMQFMVISFFWTLGLLYSLLDMLRWPNFLYRYKVQDTTVTWRDIVHTAKRSLFNQLTVQPVTIVCGHWLGQLRGQDNLLRVPGWTTILTHLAVFALVQEVTFYYGHWLLHQKFLYKRIHKVHHRWQAPIAISALYCHPLEHVFANLLPVMIGPILLGSHRSTIAIWLLIVHLVTMNDHSGYHFPLLPSPEFHDYHHLMFNQNYGRMGILDYLHGTSDRYLKSINCKRHQVLLSFTPIKFLIRDN